LLSPAPFLTLWPETAGKAARLINHTENHSFLVDGRYVLRVHPPSRSRDAIDDELRWLSALRRDTDLVLPEQLRPVGMANGQSAVLFRYIPGVEPVPGVPLFEQLGRWAATLHLNAGQGPHRPIWDEGLLDADGPWGDWRTMSTELNGLDAHLRARLAAYGKSENRFGLIHADMRLANVLADGDRLALIDFDDCGLGWFMYDFAAAVSFLETDERLPAFRDAWLRGYTAMRPLESGDIDILGTMILLRRMALLAWIGIHADTGLARAHVATFAADTLRLAEALL
jgi:Ser/Thr protein kinase RdoA (MazF antagonist)